MDKKALDWLLAGPAWLKYAVELQLLYIKPDIAPVLQDNSIQKLILRLKGNSAGIPAIKSGKVHYTEAGKAYWDLFFLADTGLTVEDAGLEAEAEEIFRYQSRDGTFTMPPNVQDNYFCMSAILIASLAKMGYRDDPRVIKYIRAAMSAQMTGGGWDCYGDSYGSGDSCPMDDMNILMLLGQYLDYRDSPRLQGAIDHLLAHWEEGTHLYGFGVGKRFRSLQYPAVKYGILRVLDTLSLFPYAVKKQGFQTMLDYVHGKAVSGRYFAEPADMVYTDFDFSQTTEPSRWITFLVSRMEKRVAGV
ncbi:MAG: hypothetical protein A2Y89_07395 [Chloroflexi bacterium RBG_13_51_18]|nr:MAG: hypothetical protein A2Y89_07395 [Chloroflexi bacterium RBG_13_51_18]